MSSAQFWKGGGCFALRQVNPHGQPAVGVLVCFLGGQHPWGICSVQSVQTLMGSHAAGLLEQVSPLLQNFEIARKGLNCSQLLFSYCPSVSLEFSSPLV